MNVITNRYPIFLQRYNRIRIKRVLRKMKTIEKSDKLL
ncbi:hypothetical protein ACFFF5_09750 [Lederbergia wuyishanensis]